MLKQKEKTKKDNKLNILKYRIYLLIDPNKNKNIPREEKRLMKQAWFRIKKQREVERFLELLPNLNMNTIKKYLMFLSSVRELNSLNEVNKLPEEIKKCILENPEIYKKYRKEIIGLSNHDIIILNAGLEFAKDKKTFLENYLRYSNSDFVISIFKILENKEGDEFIKYFKNFCELLSLEYNFNSPSIIENINKILDKGIKVISNLNLTSKKMDKFFNKFDIYKRVGPYIQGSCAVKAQRALMFIIKSFIEINKKYNILTKREYKTLVQFYNRIKRVVGKRRRVALSPIHLGYKEVWMLKGEFIKNINKYSLSIAVTPHSSMYGTGRDHFGLVLPGGKIYENGGGYGKIRSPETFTRYASKVIVYIPPKKIQKIAEKMFKAFGMV